MSKYKGRSKAQIRNLAQYKELSDEDFEEIWTKELLDSQPSEDLEKRIEEKLQEFENDYDLSDLKINDKASLRGLIQAFLTLEDYEQVLFKVRAEGITQASLQNQEKLGKIMSELRSDISKFQDDLAIKRKARKSDKETSILGEIENLKAKAKRFYWSRSSYILCPKCNLLLGSVWTLFPEEDRNKITLICNRHLDNGEICGEKIVVSTKEMLENRGSNLPELLPESLL